MRQRDKIIYVLSEMDEICFPAGYVSPEGYCMDSLSGMGFLAMHLVKTNQLLNTIMNY